MENKIKIEMVKKNNSTFKIGDNVVKIKSWLSCGEVAFIVDDTLKFFKKLINEQNGDATALVSAFAQMNMMIVAVATNLDIESLDTDDVGSTGLFNAIQEKVLNYNMIKDAVIAGMSMVGDGIIITQLSKIASVEDLQNATEELDTYLKSENSEQVQKLIEVMLANNPMLAKTLNNELATGDQDGHKQ